MATPKGGLQHPRPTRVLSLRRIESYNGVEDKVRFLEGGVGGQTKGKGRMVASSYNDSESSGVTAGKARKASGVAYAKL